MMAYGGPRSSKIIQITKVQFFGLQAFIKERLLKPITHADIDYARERIRLHGGGAIFFAEADFRKIVDVYEGYIPVKIRAVKEGTNTPVGEIQYTIECDDPDLFWMVQFIETELLRAVWYPSTVSTISKACKKIIYKFLLETSDDPDGQINFKLHDFGARGVSSNESAELGGMAHLVNFMGTDTLTALEAAMDYYRIDMAGYSINASEHATITSWKKHREFDAYANMIKQFGKPGSMFACVSDSYDIENAVAEGWGTVLKKAVIDSGSILVVRPDSGDPISTVVKVIMKLDEKYGSVKNKKGYKVLNHVRVIQGDGVDIGAIESILFALKINGYSADNIAFGMGGALLQKVDRDLFGYAQKVCAAYSVAEGWFDIFKEAPGKASKRGRVKLVLAPKPRFMHGVIADILTMQTVKEEVTEIEGFKVSDLLETVYDCGYVHRDENFDEIRAAANADLMLDVA
jgi:nicotinamide phosphoribosyltransferase